jgi:hypothetical protein
MQSKETTTLIPCVVVDKIVNPMNPGVLVQYASQGDGKTVGAKLVFKKTQREAEYIVVASSRDGVDYNIKTDRISWTKIKILDTLWTIK